MTKVTVTGTSYMKTTTAFPSAHQKTGYWRPGIALLKTEAMSTHTQLPASRGSTKYIQPRVTILAFPCHTRTPSEVMPYRALACAWDMGVG